MSWYDDYLASLPQTSLSEIQSARAKTTDPEEQRRLSMEDRRAYAREQAYEKGVSGAAQMGLLIPAEQAAKAALTVPLIGPMVGHGLSSIGIPVEQSRTGFHNPFPTIGAGYNGILQGLRDRQLYGPPR